MQKRIEIPNNKTFNIKELATFVFETCLNNGFNKVIFSCAGTAETEIKIIERFEKVMRFISFALMDKIYAPEEKFMICGDGRFLKGFTLYTSFKDVANNSDQNTLNIAINPQKLYSLETVHRMDMDNSAIEKIPNCMTIMNMGGLFQIRYRPFGFYFD